MKNISILFLLLTISILSSCTKEYDETIIIPGEIEEPKRIVNSSLVGQIMHGNRYLLEDATIHVGNEITTSNEFGWFNFENIPMDANGQLIKITKEGFYDQYKLIYPEVNKKPYVSALLINKVQTGSFTSSNGGEIIGDKLKINFQPNSIVDDQNQPYTGEVIVYQAPINPDDENFDVIVPGNLRSRNENGENTILQSFAMSVVQLENPSGTLLNIKEGFSAQLSFNIPDTHLSEAPESIPLWYFNEDTGYLMEDGKANKVGSEYVGDVSHFSFWNCDISRNAFFLSFRLINDFGQPMNHTPVRVRTSTGLMSNTVYTDSDGYASGIVPGFIPLSLNLDALECNLSNIIPIGSIVEDTYLGDILDEEVDHPLATVKAQIVDCNNIPLPNMKILIKTTLNFSGTKYFEATSDSEGNLSLTLDYCEFYTGEYQITEPLTGLSSTIVQFDGTLDNSDQDLGKIMHCIDTTPYIFVGCETCPYSTDNITATISETGTTNEDKVIKIQSTNANGSLNIDIYISKTTGKLAFRYDDNPDITTDGIWSFNGFCGSCGIIQESFNHIQGIPGEILTGFLYVEFPNDPDNLEFIQLSVPLSE